MPTLAIIGGTSLSQLDELSQIEQHTIDTPFGKPSSAVIQGQLHGKTILFLARHGEQHTIPPHKINYRANCWALQQLGADKIIAIAAVGGISPQLSPNTLAIPDQLIDYSYGREQSFFSDDFSPDKHLDFTHPYDETLRQQLLKAAQHHNINIIDGGTYATTQGPRLETAAEIKRLAQDGCTMVGMTGMPEAYLARELDIAYATCALSVNWAAGLCKNEISMAEINNIVSQGMGRIKQLLAQVIQQQ